MAKKLLGNFSHEDRVLIAITADPDAMSSALAFKRLLWRQVASVTIARTNEISRPDNLTMVRLLNIPMEPIESVNPAMYNKHVLVDSQPHHHKAFAALTPNVIIDHHPLAEASQKADYVDVRPRFGATATIMTHYLRGAKIKPSTRLATALVYGIKNDTAGFQRPCLEEDVVAFRHVFKNANSSVLRKIEFSEMGLKDLDFVKEALSRRMIRKNCMFSHLGKVKNPDTLVMIADFFLKVDTVDSTAVSGVYQDKLVVIVRSAHIRKNAGKMTELAFGPYGSAGGHRSMARAEIPLSVLEEHLKTVDEQSLTRLVVRRIQGAGKRVPAAKAAAPAAKAAPPSERPVLPPEKPDPPAEAGPGESS